MTERVTSAVIGLGDFGMKHLELLSKNPRCDLIPVVGRTASKAEFMAVRFNVPRCYVTPEALFAAETPRAVSVATAGTYHLRPSLLALQHGAAVLLEKPVVLNSADGALLAAAEVQSSGFVMPAHILRFAEPYREVKRRIDSGEIGVPVSFAFRRYRQQNHDARFPDMHPAFMTAVHDIDLALWMSVAAAVEVTRAEVRIAEFHQPAVVWATVRGDNGTLWSFQVSWLLPDDTPVLNAVERFGSKGYVTLGADEALREISTERPESSMDLAVEDLDAALAAEPDHFMDCADAGTPSPLVRLEDVLRGIAIAERVAGGTKKLEFV